MQVPSVASWQASPSIGRSHLAGSARYVVFDSSPREHSDDVLCRVPSSFAGVGGEGREKEASQAKPATATL